MTFHVPDKHRVTSGAMRSDASFGNNGAFIISSPRGCKLQVVAADGLGWEHVSVSVRDIARCPTWDEMCLIKGMFWDVEDCVVQYHPPESEYVNNHPYVLHMWRQIGAEFPRPPHELVGIRRNSNSLAVAALLAMAVGVSA